MVMKLYYADWSPPVRAVLMVVDLLNVPVEKVELELFNNRENLQQDYKQMNPVHTIPTLEDGDFVLHDSHAIITYFVQTYGKDDTLYPKDIKQRALVDQKLYFDAAVLFTRIRSITFALFGEGVKTLTEKQYKDLEETYGFLETFLTKTKWLAGNNMTLADISVIASVTSIELIVPIDATKYPRLSAWKSEMEKQSFCKNNNKAGVKRLAYQFKKYGLNLPITL